MLQSDTLTIRNFFFCLAITVVVTDSAWAQPPNGMRHRALDGPKAIPNPGRQFFDRNRDGVIDQEEYDRAGKGLRDIFERQGVKVEVGMTVEEIGAQFAESVRKAAQNGPRPVVLMVNTGSEQQPSAANRENYQPPSPFRARKKQRLTKDLPAEYSDLDTDFDGQIGLYEWIVARRDDLSLFDEIDEDKDGFLTPRELVFYHEVTSGSPQAQKTAETFKRPRLLIVGGPSATGSGNGQKSFLKPEEREKQVQYAQKAFPYLDTNKDGRITAEEFSRSRRVRPMFEKAGIEFREMSQEQFQQNYLRAVEFFARQKAEQAAQAGDQREGERRDRGGRSGYGR